MKRNLLSFFIFLCAFTIQAQQYTLTDDDVVVTDGVIMSCSYDFEVTDIIIPETLDGQTVTEIYYEVFSDKGITSVVFPETLLKIGPYTFFKNELSTVIIPNSVTEIGTGAFRSNELTSVTLSISITVLENQVFESNNLTSIIIPEGVTEIGEFAFWVNSLTSVSIPNSVTKIGEKAFGGSSNLASITLPTVATTGFISWIDEDGNTYENGTVVTNVASFFIAQFAQTLADDDVVVVDGIITSCTLNDSTTSITIPEVLDGQTIIGLGEKLFYNKGLTAVNLTNTITTIGNYVFYNCNLTAIILPSNLTSIGKYAFYKNSLTEVLLPETLTTLGQRAFYENNLKEVEIPGSVTEIENYAFGANYDLAKVTINEGVTSIGDNAFGYCYDLTDLSIPNSVIYIGAGAFDGYTSQLTSFTLPTPTKTGYTVNWIDSNSVEYATGAEVTDKAVSYTANFEINTYVISGTVTGANGVSLTLSGDVEETQTITTSGDTYSFNVEYDKSVELTATKLGYVFDTEQYSFPNIYGDKTETNFVASINEELNTYVPDDDFEQALIDLGYDDVLNDYVLTDNINTITSLDVSSKSIADITGIEDFVALTYLNCSSNSLTSLEINSNTVIEKLYCSSNQLTSLDVSGNTALEDLVCWANDLTSLDVSANTALTYLSCSSNALTSIDVSANIALTYLNVTQTSLTSLDVSTNTALTRLDCNLNSLTSLDVSTNTALTWLQCHENNLTSIDVSANTALTTFWCDSNQLKRVNLRNGNNSIITSFNATNNPNLSCIQVDDAAWSTTNWTDIDEQSYFNEESCYTYVPDDNFEQALIDLGYDDVLDDYVLTDNINSVTYLDVDSKSISDLTGIEDFVALTFLSCYNNQLTSIDVSKNTELYRLSCSSNQIEAIDVSKNLKLTYLGVSDNNLTNLDVGVNTLLENLYCSSNSLSSLDLSSNTALIILKCYSNSLTSLDVSLNTALTSLSCSSNALISINVANGNNSNFSSFIASSNPDLTCIQVDDAAWCTTNWTDIDEQSYFSEENCYTYVPDDNFEQALIDLGYDDILDDYVLTTNINTLTYLNVTSKSISDLTGIEAFTALTTLYCDSNQLSVLDVSSNLAITDLRCESNNLTSLDVSANIALTYLLCRSNQLTSLDVSGNTALTYLSCYSNQLTSLNVANGNNSNFSYFYAFNNPNLTCIQVDDAAWSTTNWTSIDATASFSEDCHFDDTYVPDDNFEQALIDLGYDDILDDYVLTTNINTLTSLNVSSRNISDLTGIEAFTALTTLYCYYNQLTSLDVNTNTALTTLWCYSNQLTSLDVSGNTALTTLWCFSNQLTSLNVGGNTALTTLYCGSNQLTSLDVSGNRALTNLSCESNQLTSLDVSSNTALTKLYCYNNDLTSLNVANGNNSNFYYAYGDAFTARYNPNLTCIQVDDVEYSTTNWTAIDDTASFSEDCSSTLGTDEFEVSNFSVYPNPSKGMVYISIEEEATYQLVNLTGQVITQGKLTVGTNNLNFSGYNKSIYFLTVKTNTAIYTKKIILE